MYEHADWSYRREHIWEKHRLTVEEAEEALADPNRLVFDPDPRRNPGGKGVRIIGYSHTAQEILAVILVNDDGTIYGGTAHKANAKEIRLYQREDLR